MKGFWQHEDGGAGKRSISTSRLRPPHRSLPRSVTGTESHHGSKSPSDAVVPLISPPDLFLAAVRGTLPAPRPHDKRAFVLTFISSGRRSLGFEAASINENRQPVTQRCRRPIFKTGSRTSSIGRSRDLSTIHTITTSAFKRNEFYSSRGM